MLFAIMARFLLGQPLLVQSIALGACTGLFAAAATEASDRTPEADSTAVAVLCWGSAAAALFYAGGRTQGRARAKEGTSAPRWLHLAYAVVWLAGLAAALMALFGAGGFKVAVLAVVPLVLLAPTAFYGMAQLVRRGPEDLIRNG